jgi:hypothetical protein
MSSRGTVSKQPNRQGKRKQPFTEREARRLLRAARVEGEKCILRKLPDGTLELVPMPGVSRGADDGEDLSKLI